MKNKIIILFIILIYSCSFDNKSGIWKNENLITEDTNDSFREFKKLTISSNPFNKIINIKKDFNFKTQPLVDVKEWNDIFYSDNNNLQNFKYLNLNEKNYRSKKITRKKINQYILSENNNIIFSDLKGNIFIFSLKEKKLINKFNFYKNRFKNIEKKLNLIVNNGIIFASDNIGFLYAIDYRKNKVIWAKNYKIPFRSNLKISQDKLLASNQNNKLYFLNKYSGDISKLIPTEETSVKNRFINNLSLSNNYLLFLNTYGSLYAVNKKNMEIKWFVNLNQSLDINPSNLFLGNQIVNKDNKIIVSSNRFTFIIEAETGTILFRKNFSSIVKPIIINGHFLSISKNKFLIATNMNNGKILFSLDINKEIANYLKIKKKDAQIKSMMIVNNKIFVFLKNSFLLKFDLNGKLKNIDKLPYKINTFPIIIDGSIMFFDFKNRLSVVN
ncbi:PQQ-binding-like beta-propeller repeat protein [Candidatus Pelagibacter communis]|uniref:PQQ-binding-like beta-propeller repeat protein n=1 Tax=Pelagibacter ubique TaxID=198252 RepID=UPI00094C6EE8|nr:PQQ-binding-like beta-propeller repeat protein [Candidatus Pelagibacter ubique]